jgi:hypothetical protein
MRIKRRLRRPHKGLQVVGPGFYLWDTDAHEALRLAAELTRRPMPLLSVRRPQALLRKPIA